MKQLWQILKLLKAKCSRPPKFPGNFPSMVRNSLDLKYISRDPCFCSACAVVANMAIVNLVISRPKRSVVPLSRRSTVHSAKLRKWQCSKTQNLMGRSAGRTLLRPLGSKCKDQEFIWISQRFNSTSQMCVEIFQIACKKLQNRSGQWPTEQSEKRFRSLCHCQGSTCRLTIAAALCSFSCICLRRKIWHLVSQLLGNGWM